MIIYTYSLDVYPVSYTYANEGDIYNKSYYTHMYIDLRGHSSEGRITIKRNRN